MIPDARRGCVAVPYDTIDDAVDVMIGLGDCGDMLPTGGVGRVRPDSPPDYPPASAPPLAA